MRIRKEPKQKQKRKVILISDTEFVSLLQKAEELLTELEKKMQSGEISDNTKEKSNILLQLKPVVAQLNEQWKMLQMEAARLKERELTNPSASPKMSKRKARFIKAKSKFHLAVKRLNTMINKIRDSLSATERNFRLQTQQEVDRFNESLDESNSSFVEIMQKYKQLKRDTKYIVRLEYSKQAVTYMTYATAATKGGFTAWLAWVDSLNEATKLAGTIFYPISATFTTLINTCSFLFRTCQYYIARDQYNKSQDSMYKEELARRKASLRRSAAFKFVASVFNTLSILAFLGVLTTPVGFAFIAAATTVNWIDDGLGAYLEAKESLREYEDSIPNLKDLNEDEQREHSTFQKKVTDAKTAAIWGFANTVAVILAACAPIPVIGPFLGLAGLALLGVATMRNVIVNGKPFVRKLFGIKEQHEMQETELTESPRINSSEKRMQMMLKQGKTAGPSVEPTVKTSATAFPISRLTRSSASNNANKAAASNTPVYDKEKGPSSAKKAG